MDYEKKYKDALERAKRLTSDMTTLQKIREFIFPELAESEDERIRKWLYDYISNCPNNNFAFYGGVGKDAVLKYLEKQKYDRMQPVYDNLDSFGSALAKAWKAYNDSGSRTVDGCEDDYVECAHAKGFREGYLFGLEKQKEQKPNIELIQRSWYMEGYHDREFGKEPKWVIKTGEGGPKHELNPRYGEPLCDEQHPSSKYLPGGWVVYDGPLGHAILQIKDVIDGRYTFVDNDSTLLVEDSDKFLRPLTPEDVEKPAEWGEEDDKIRRNLMSLLANLRGNGIKEETYQKYYPWLKSLRPSWKPSEEQKEALEYVIRDYREDCCNATANYLQEVLDHLKNM